MKLSLRSQYVSDAAAAGAGSYRYTHHLQAMDRCRPTGPPTLPVGLASASSSPLRWTSWAECLAAHPDQEYANYIVQGIQSGFRLGFDYSGHSCKRATRNMGSALERPEVVGDYLAEECSLGRVVGPLDPGLYPTVQVSRFGVIPKSDTGKYRLIVDLSSPDGRSVNDGIESDLCTLSYIKVDDAVRAVQEKGRGARLAKVDVRSAYRIVPVHPEDRWLLGMMWEGALYIDTVLPFGLRSSAKIFNAIADAVEWFAGRQGVRSLFHYLDDFLIVGEHETEECGIHLTMLLTIFDYLDIPVAVEKTEGPTTRLIFLGIELDTEEMTLRLPEKKLRKLQTLIAEWLGRKSCRKRDLQSLAGKLQHACKVVRPGRTFLRRVFSLLKGTSKKHHHIRLGEAFRSDLLWWHTFLASWNGVAMMPSPPARGMEVSTDASGSVGCGAWWSPHWLQRKWCQGGHVADLPITQKEVLPVVLGCAVWGPRWFGARVTVHCDNEAAVTVLNSGYSQDPQIMHMLRCLFFIKAHFQIELRVAHIRGAVNVVADAISRDNLGILFSQVPPPDPAPTPIPPRLLEVLVTGQPDWTSVDWTRLFASCFRPV